MRKNLNGKNDKESKTVDKLTDFAEGWSEFKFQVSDLSL